MNTEAKQYSEDAALWIERSRKDYEAAKPLKTQDPALAIYLLQQCIEKSVKALAVASGEFDFAYIKREFKHNSKYLLMELWKKLSASKSSSTLSSIFNLRDLTDPDFIDLFRLHFHAYFKRMAVKIFTGPLIAIELMGRGKLGFDRCAIQSLILLYYSSMMTDYPGKSTPKYSKNLGVCQGVYGGVIVFKMG